MGVLLRADGWITTLRPANSGYFTLEDLIVLVGGGIEVVRAPGLHRFLVFNQAGKDSRLKPNPNATKLFHRAGGDRMFEIMGDCVLMKMGELGGPG